jgi:hypothetical protein
MSHTATPQLAPLNKESEAENGSVAMDLMRAHREDIDVILLDVTWIIHRRSSAHAAFDAV